MTAKPWGECPLCSKLATPGLLTFRNPDGSSITKTCPCAAIRRAAFEEALMEIHPMHSYYAKIRAKMEAS